MAPILSAPLNPTPEFISQPWWTQRQFGSILSSLFMMCLPTELQGRWWYWTDLHPRQKCTRVQPHMIFFHSLVAVCLTVCTLRTCCPICKKIHLHTKHRSTVPVILSENKVKKQSDAHKCSVYVSVSQVICFSTDYSLNHCSHKQRIAKILHPPNYPPHILYKNYTAHLCPGVDKRNRAG